jgi:uncharacterized membrane protein
MSAQALIPITMFQWRALSRAPSFKQHEIAQWFHFPCDSNPFSSSSRSEMTSSCIKYYLKHAQECFIIFNDLILLRTILRDMKNSVMVSYINMF